MSTKPNRRQVMIGAASVAAGAVLPAASVVAVLPEAAASVPVQPVAAVAEDFIGLYVSGCGRACDCDQHMRCWGADDGGNVWKCGDRYVIRDREYKIIGEAEPGFKPTPDEADWIAKIEYAEREGLPHPYHWPQESHLDWSLLHDDLDTTIELGLAYKVGQWPRSGPPGVRGVWSVWSARQSIAEKSDRAVETVTVDEIYRVVRYWGMSYDNTVVALQWMPWIEDDQARWARFQRRLKWRCQRRRQLLLAGKVSWHP